MANRNLKVLFVFALVYIALYVLSVIGPFQDWSFSTNFGMLNYHLLLLPVPGFFFVYFLLSWARDELGFGKYFLYAFPLLFLLGSYIAFAVALYSYFGNQAFLSGVDISVFKLDFFRLDFLTFKLFVESAFIYFVFICQRAK